MIYQHTTTKRKAQVRLFAIVLLNKQILCENCFQKHLSFNLQHTQQPQQQSKVPKHKKNMKTYCTT